MIKYLARKSQIQKMLRLRKIRKSKNYVRPQLVDLRFAELNCGPPPSINIQHQLVTKMSFSGSESL
jgi:hypothetical protein